MPTFTKVLPNSSYQLELITSISSTDKMNNKSRVSYSVLIRKLSGYGRYSKYKNTWVVDVDGQRHSGTLNQYNFDSKTNLGIPPGPNPLTIASGYFDVSHNANGARTIYCSVSFTENEVYNIGSGSAGGYMDLTTFNRVANITSVPGSRTLGDQYGIGWSHQSNGLTHVINVKLGSNLLYSRSSLTTGGTTYFTENSTEVGKILNLMSTSSGTVTYELLTYAGSTYLGTSTRTGTIWVPNIALNLSASAISLKNNLGISVTGPEPPSGGYYTFGLSKTNGSTTPAYGKQYSVGGKSHTFRTDDSTFMTGVMETAGSGSTYVTFYGYAVLFNHIGVQISRSNFLAIRINLTPLTVSFNYITYLDSVYINSTVTGNYVTGVTTEYSLDGGAYTALPFNKTIPLSRSSLTHTIKLRVKEYPWNYLSYSSLVSVTLAGELSVTMPSNRNFVVDEDIPISYRSYQTPAKLQLIYGDIETGEVYKEQQIAPNKSGLVNFSVSSDELDKASANIHLSSMSYFSKMERVMLEGFNTVSDSKAGVMPRFYIDEVVKNYFSSKRFEAENPKELHGVDYTGGVQYIQLKPNTEYSIYGHNLPYKAFDQSVGLYNGPGAKYTDLYFSKEGMTFRTNSTGYINVVLNFGIPLFGVAFGPNDFYVTLVEGSSINSNYVICQYDAFIDYVPSIWSSAEVILGNGTSRTKLKHTSSPSKIGKNYTFSISILNKHKPFRIYLLNGGSAFIDVPVSNSVQHLKKSFKGTGTSLIVELEAPTANDHIIFNMINMYLIEHDSTNLEFPFRVIGITTDANSSLVLKKDHGTVYVGYGGNAFAYLEGSWKRGFLHVFKSPITLPDSFKNFMHPPSMGTEFIIGNGYERLISQDSASNLSYPLYTTNFVLKYSFDVENVGVVGSPLCEVSVSGDSLSKKSIIPGQKLTISGTINISSTAKDFNVLIERLDSSGTMNLKFSNLTLSTSTGEWVEATPYVWKGSSWVEAGN